MSDTLITHSSISTAVVDKGPVVVALDVDSLQQAVAIAERLNPTSCRLKVGKQLFTREGPQVVEALQKLGFDIFLDLKFHDIPNTVAKAVKSAADLGVWMVNVHALGSIQMMEFAAESIANVQNKPLLIAVTILTSHSQESVNLVGLNQPIQQLAVDLATLAHQSGLDGVVCSAHEAGQIKTIDSNFITVTPGIRLIGQDTQDQTRVMTPEKALYSGSDYLVMGRSIVGADNPQAVIEDINSL